MLTLFNTNNMPAKWGESDNIVVSSIIGDESDSIVVSSEKKYSNESPGMWAETKAINLRIMDPTQIETTL